MIWFHLISAFFQVNYRNHIALNLATAHPHYDDEGNTYNMGTALMGLGLPQYVIFKVPAEAAGTRTEAPGEGLKHDLDLCSDKASEMTSENASATRPEREPSQLQPAAFSTVSENAAAVLCSLPPGL